MAFSEDTIIDLTVKYVHSVMEWSTPNYWFLWTGVIFFSSLISLAPWKLPTEHDFADVFLHFWRRVLFWSGIILFVGLLIVYYFYDLGWRDRIPNHFDLFKSWLLKSLLHYGWMLPVSAVAGFGLRFYYFRFIHPWVSSVMRRWRNLQVEEVESDIRNERARYNAKDFEPPKHYDPKKEKIFMGLDIDNKPVYVPAKTWRSNNMQVVGPTGFGKGVMLGCLMDQAIRFGDALFYIDPKEDEWAPRLMLQAAQECNRPFIYISLRDNGYGYWSPFLGGPRRNAYTRMINIFGMVESGGDSDFYKIVEKMQLNRLIGPNDSYDLETLYGKIKSGNKAQKNDRDKALKVEALLENWRQISSLNPGPEKKSFSIEQALLDGAIVYVQGDLQDDVVKTATKALIMEVIQEAMRLKAQRKHHLTLIVDEVSFLVSKQLRDALATNRSFNVNIVTAYQSVTDLEAPDDKTLDGKALAQSINVNSQLKLFYGGADYQTAEWVSQLSGTITKEVTAMEKTRIRTAGAEEWEQGRTVKRLEEALIPLNVILTLPHRVSVFFQPGQLATPVFTAPAPVKDGEQLAGWLAKHKSDFDAPAEPASQLEHAQEEDVFVETPAPKATDTSTPPAPPVTPNAKPKRKAEPAKPVEHAQPDANTTSPTQPAAKYDLDLLVLKGLDALNDDELKWIFSNTKRQQLLAGKASEAAIKSARAKFHQQKSAKKPSKEVAPLDEQEASLEHAQVQTEVMEAEASDDFDVFADEDKLTT